MENKKVKKQFYKRWWFWLIAIIIIAVCFGTAEDSSDNSKQANTNTVTKTKETTPKKKAEEPKVEAKPVVEEKNLGVSVNDIKAIFEKPEVGFTFSSSPLEDGTARQLGQSSKNKGAAMLELYGTSKLTKTYLGTFAANDSQEHNLFNLTYMIGLLKNVCPEFQEPGKWLSKALKEVADDPSKTVTKQLDGKVIKISLKKELGLFELVIDPN